MNVSPKVEKFLAEIYANTGRPPKPDPKGPSWRPFDGPEESWTLLSERDPMDEDFPIQLRNGELPMMVVGRVFFKQLREMVGKGNA